MACCSLGACNHLVHAEIPKLGGVKNLSVCGYSECCLLLLLDRWTGTTGCGHLAGDGLVPEAGGDQGDQEGQLRLHQHRRSREGKK